MFAKALTAFALVMAIGCSVAAAQPRIGNAPGQKQMSTATSKDGTRIGYEKVGNGPLLIVVGGATAFRASDPNFAALADLLAPTFTVITYDRRGRGESTDTLPYAPEREIEDILALVQTGGGRASLLGYSSGAVLALEAAAAGLPIDKVIMYEPPIVPPGSNFPRPPVDVIQTLDRLTAAGDRGGAVAYFMSTVGTPPEAVEATKRSPMWPLMESIAPTLAYDWRVLFRAYYTDGKFPDRWMNVRIPVLVLNGTASFPFMPMAADAVAAVLPNASRKVLEGQDHAPKPDAMAPVIRQFLSR